MSGVETAIGLALGMLPLFISVLENYERTLVPFQTYRYFPRELRQIKLKLQIQDDIFRNECVWLLSTIVDKRELEEMLGEKSHSLRTRLQSDPVMEQRFSEYLGRSLKSVEAVLEQMGTAFDELHAELARLSHGISDTQKFESIGDKPWRRRVAAKLKLSLKKKALDGKLDELHRLNTQLRTLSAQVIRLSHDGKNDTGRITYPSDRRLESFGVIREASRRLCESLDSLWVCPEHKHSVNLAIEAGADRSDVATAVNVRFEMAVTYWVIEQSVWESPVWVDVESTVYMLEGEKGSRAALRKSHNALTDAVNSLSVQADRRSQGAGLATGTIASAAGAIVSETEPLEMADLYCHASLCLRFQQLQHLLPANKRVLVGVLERPAGVCKHRIYRPPTTKFLVSSNSISLAEVISLSSKGNHHPSLGISERMRLAKLLAISVLQFHSTPWLEGNWRSRDVHFFGIKDTAQQRDSLKSPYLNAYCKPAKGVRIKSLPQLPVGGITPPPQPGIRNDVLFGLGVMLLELGQKAPLQPDTGDVDHATAEFIEAHRRANMVQTQLGREYGIVVRKCLNCDFGLAVEEYNLKNVELQKVFYRDVVCKLEQLEEGCNMIGF